MPAIEPPSFPDRVFDVRDFGAVGDGTTLEHSRSTTKAMPGLGIGVNWDWIRKHTEVEKE
jgi:hypothetical protein